MGKEIKSMDKIKSALMTMGKGLVRSLWGTAVVGAVGLAVYGYTVIPGEGGYVAVAEFIVSSCILCIATAGMYIMGGNTKKEGKK